MWIFARQNGKPTDDWSFSINLNSLIAAISTVYRAVLVAVAATVISQLKWTWFWSKSSPPRSLRHISDFDNASRGIWGALRLIPIVVTHSLPAMLALIVIIFSFATGPFFPISDQHCTEKDSPCREDGLPPRIIFNEWQRQGDILPKFVGQFLRNVPDPPPGSWSRVRGTRQPSKQRYQHSHFLPNQRLYISKLVSRGNESR